MNRITASIYQKGNYSLAAEVARAALEYAESSLGGEHPDTLTSVHNLALLYQAQAATARPSPCTNGRSRPANGCSAGTIPIPSPFR